MPAWISIFLVLAATLAVASVAFWALTARRVNVANRTAQIEALAQIGRRADGKPAQMPDQRCSCGHPRGIHQDREGVCLRLIKSRSMAGTLWRACGCEGWNP